VIGKQQIMKREKEKGNDWVARKGSGKKKLGQTPSKEDARELQPYRKKT